MEDLREQHDTLQLHCNDLMESKQKLLRDKRDLSDLLEGAARRELEDEVSMLREAARRNEEARLDIERRTRSQMNDLSQRLEAAENRYDAVKEGIKPVLDIIEYVPADPPTGAPGPFDIIHWSHEALRHFKAFCTDVAENAAAHVLGVVRSHYPGMNNDRVKGGYARGTTEQQEDQLEEEAKLAVELLAADMQLFLTENT